MTNMAALEEVVEESSEEDERENESEREDVDRTENEQTSNRLENDVNIAQQTPIPPTPEVVHTPQLPNLALAALQRLAANRSEESPDDFRPLKRRRVTKLECKEEEDAEEETDEGQCCSICLEPWSNSGIHRIASLRCGHLFGYSCIEKWLKAQDGRCPQCNSKAKKKDIRVIFAKSISVVDTTERDRALQELEEERQARILAQKSEAQSLLQYQLAKAECDRIRTELKEVRKQLEEYTSSSSEGAGPKNNNRAVPIITPTETNGNGFFEFLKTINIASNGGARVIANDPVLGMIVASKKSSNQVFPGYGLAKLSLLDLKLSEFVPVHDSQIRDVLFSPRGDGLTLTAGMDKALKLTSMHSNQVVQNYTLPVPAWACCWNKDDPNYIFCGLSNGTLTSFDLRQTTTHVTELKLPNGSHVPITSLGYVPLCRASCLNCSGILVGTLDGVVFWEKDKESFEPHSLDCLSGSCVSVSFEEASRHCLASFRPSKRAPKSRHTVCQLQNTPLTDPFSCNPLHQFTGGSSQRLLSRSLLFQKPHHPGKLLVAYGEENLNSTHICDFSSTSKLQLLKTGGEPCIDVSFVEGEGEAPPLLNLLTDSKLYVYKWII